MKTLKRKICVFSGKRGGFGAYVPLMRLIEKDPILELQILLGDMHASKEFGNTADEAHAAFPSATIELVEMGAGRGDTPEIRAENLSVCLQKAAGVLERIRPDIVMVHGDRGEHLMVAFAALNLGIPVTHSQGGEISGNIDDVQRHAITKLAHIHFPEMKDAARRIRGLGEEPWRIHVVGSLYIDRIVKKMYTDTAAAKQKYGLGGDDEYVIALFHPDTFWTKEQNYRAAQAMLAALKSAKLKTVLLYPCSDPGYEGVIQAIDEMRSDPDFLIHKNIENLDFLGLMADGRFIIGNSSSALVEAPYFKLPAINIGNRQRGRDREENIVDAKPTERGIGNAIHYALTDAGFKKNLARCGKRLGDGNASERVLEVIKNLRIDERLMRKKMV
ncbi:MAG: UDP-N-acetylglucosamine 2-epimerase [Patescibacteria group bacterium]